MSEPYKLRIKIGEAEFEAEGERDTVDAQFAAFMAAMAAMPKPAAAAPPPEPSGVRPNDNGGRDTAEPSALVQKAFQVSKDLVSLKYLPRSAQKESDALLLLIYGYAALKGQEQVLGTQLIRAARQSGVSLDRVDRALAKHDSLLLKGGARKGVKYGLNNQGKRTAEEMLSALFEA